MNKPLLLICPGIGKCGTTMLYEILRHYNTYLHAGIEKESSYLCLAHAYRENLMNNVWMEENHFKRHLKNELNYPPTVKNLPTSLPDSIYTQWSSEKYNLQTYVDYYLQLYDQIKSTYFGVCDFSTSYSNYKFEQSLQEIDEYLSKYFSVKVVIIFRDPIARLFSFHHMMQTGKEFQHIKKLMMQELNSLHDTKDIVYTVKDFFDVDIQKSYIQNLYPNIYNKFYSVFKNRVLVLSEKVFDPKKSKQRNQLSKFLELPIIDIENIKRKNTQIYTENLTQEQIAYAKILLKPSLDFYKSMF